MLKKPILHTYSIAAYDPATQSWGVASASKFLAIGGFNSYAKAGIGAITTQANTNMRFGPQGLELLAKGKRAQEVIDALVKTDTDAHTRQVGVIDAKGNAASFTGSNCESWAGSIIGDGYTIQGNMLTGNHVLTAMETAFKETSGDLAHRLTATLLAGDQAGGDKRGKQSAALVVVKENAGYGGTSDRFVDLRVDDHPSPVIELVRLVKLFYTSNNLPA